MNPNTYRFQGKLWRMNNSLAAYIIFPGDIKEIFGKGLVYAHFKIEHLEFDACIMNKGHKHYKNRPTYTISLSKERFLELGVPWGEKVTVTVKERERDK